MKKLKKKMCRHEWDFTTTLWHGGQRKHPCKKCPENLVIGSIKIKEVI